MKPSVGSNILILSPYHTGSHKSWAEGYRSSSRNSIDILTLPGRFWKWRMHGGAVSLAQELSRSGKDHALWITTDMLDLTVLLALTPPERLRPNVLYMHENQLTYPLPRDPETGPMRRQRGERDLHYAFINYSSMLAATQVWFNSRFHYESWFEALPRMLRHFPDHRLPSSVESLRNKSRVLPVGIRTPSADLETAQKSESGTILWNHRWEFDKNPRLFFEILSQLAQTGHHFEVIVCGENFRHRPKEFDRAREELGRRIRHWGYASRDLYPALLSQADIVVSTALHDYFGVAVAEAVAAGCFPLLPQRLAYPELIPRTFHECCLYETPEDLASRLRQRLTALEQTRQLGRELAPLMEQFSWRRVAKRYDLEVARMLAGE